jgi:tyrosine-specific transport protein
VSGTEPLVNILINVLHKPWIAKAANAFTFFAIVTSFIGVSLSLSDFLTDGLKIKRTSSGRFIACLLTFIPPLLFVYAFKRGFLMALEYGAIFVIILLCMLPALMAWHLPKRNPYRKIWGRILIIVVLIVSVAIIGITLFNKLS